VLEGRVALVTGGGKGLGAAIAVRLATAGARVAVLGRDRESIANVAREIDALPLAADVTDPGEVDAALRRMREALGDATILVQNAGIAESAPFEATSDEMWERHMAVNATAPFRIARAMVPAMKKVGWGRIVHVASTAGLVGFRYTAAYVASKHALVGLTRALAADLARTNITVNAVCPGFLDTDMTRRSVATIMEKTKRTKDEVLEEIASYSPQKRLIGTDEVAHVVMMLCSDAARGVTGQAIPIDGGQVMR
jgi:NAD(P)-dependent dehydrogenase (short-subunit alcohol dehydrogenase family)